jgi:hypothetical protein
MTYDALREMCSTKPISVDRTPMGQKDPLQFPCTEKSYAWFKKGLRLMFGGGSLAMAALCRGGDVHLRGSGNSRLPPASARSPMRPAHLPALLVAFGACGSPAAPPREPTPSAPAVVAIPLPAQAPSPPPAAPASAPPEPPEPGPRLSAAPYLAPGTDVRFPGRALVAKHGPLRLTLDGEPLSSSDPSQLSTRVEGIVVEEHARSVRLVLADEHVRLVAFAPRDALQQVSIRSALLAVAPDRAPDPSAGARIAPGVPLDEKARQGGLRRVAGEASGVRFDGWIADDAVGFVYVPERFVVAGGAGLVAESTVVTSPTGEEIARFAGPLDPSDEPSFRNEVAALPGAPVGFQAIHLRREAIELRGLVPIAGYRKKPPGVGFESGIGLGDIGTISDAQPAVLRAGGGIFSAAGDRVGVALVDTEVWVGYDVIGGGDALRRAEFLFSRFGFVSVQVRSSDLRPDRR